MAKSRPTKNRVKSASIPSLVRTRTTRKGKSRKRPTPGKLPKKLALIRERLGMSQGEIARALGVENRASISGYERGEREPPLPILLAYARLLDVCTDVIVDDTLTLDDPCPHK